MCGPSLSLQDTSGQPDPAPGARVTQGRTQRWRICAQSPLQAEPQRDTSFQQVLQPNGAQVCPLRVGGCSPPPYTSKSLIVLLPTSQPLCVSELAPSLGRNVAGVCCPSNNSLLLEPGVDWGWGGCWPCFPCLPPQTCIRPLPWAKPAHTQQWRKTLKPGASSCRDEGMGSGPCRCRQSNMGEFCPAGPTPNPSLWS